MELKEVESNSSKVIIDFRWAMPVCYQVGWRAFCSTLLHEKCCKQCFILAVLLTSFIFPPFCLLSKTLPSREMSLIPNVKHDWQVDSVFDWLVFWLAKKTSCFLLYTEPRAVRETGLIRLNTYFTHISQVVETFHAWCPQKLNAYSTCVYWQLAMSWNLGIQLQFRLLTI